MLALGSRRSGGPGGTCRTANGLTGRSQQRGTAYRGHRIVVVGIEDYIALLRRGSFRSGQVADGEGIVGSGRRRGGSPKHAAVFPGGSLLALGTLGTGVALGALQRAVVHPDVVHAVPDVDVIGLCGSHTVGIAGGRIGHRSFQCGDRGVISHHVEALSLGACGAGHTLDALDTLLALAACGAALALGACRSGDALDALAAGGAGHALDALDTLLTLGSGGSGDTLYALDALLAGSAALTRGTALACRALAARGPPLALRPGGSLAARGARRTGVALGAALALRSLGTYQSFQLLGRKVFIGKCRAGGAALALDTLDTLGAGGSDQSLQLFRREHIVGKGSALRTDGTLRALGSDQSLQLFRSEHIISEGLAPLASGSDQAVQPFLHRAPESVGHRQGIGGYCSMVAQILPGMPGRLPTPHGLCQQIVVALVAHLFLHLVASTIP